MQTPQNSSTSTINTLSHDKSLNPEKFKQQEVLLMDGNKVKVIIPNTLEPSSKPTQKASKPNIGLQISPKSQQQPADNGTASVEQVLKVKVKVPKDNQDHLATESKPAKSSKSKEENKKLQAQLALIQKERDQALEEIDSIKKYCRCSILAEEIKTIKAEIATASKPKETSSSDQESHDLYKKKIDEMSNTIQSLQQEKKKLNELLKAKEQKESITIAKHNSRSISPPNSKSSGVIAVPAASIRSFSECKTEKPVQNTEDKLQVSESEREAYQIQVFEIYNVIKSTISLLEPLLRANKGKDDAKDPETCDSPFLQSFKKLDFKLSSSKNVDKDATDDLKVVVQKLQAKVNELETQGYLVNSETPGKDDGKLRNSLGSTLKKKVTSPVAFGSTTGRFGTFGQAASNVRGQDRKASSGLGPNSIRGVSESYIHELRESHRGKILTTLKKPLQKHATKNLAKSTTTSGFNNSKEALQEMTDILLNMRGKKIGTNAGLSQSVYISKDGKISEEAPENSDEQKYPDLAASRELISSYWNRPSSHQDYHEPCKQYVDDLEDRVILQENQIVELDQRELELQKRLNKLERDYNVANRDQLKHIKELHEKNASLEKKLQAAKDSTDAKKILTLQKELERMRGQLDELKYFLMPASVDVNNLVGGDDSMDDDLSDQEFPDVDGSRQPTTMMKIRHDIPVVDKMAKEEINLTTPHRGLAKQFTKEYRDSLQAERAARQEILHKEQQEALLREQQEMLLREQQEMLLRKQQEMQEKLLREQQEMLLREQRMKEEEEARLKKEQEQAIEEELEEKRANRRKEANLPPKPHNIDLVQDERVLEIEKMVRSQGEYLRNNGVDECGIILGIDCTASNIFTGKKSFGQRHLHDLSSRKLNFYERVISIMGGIVETFHSDGRFPVYIFGDEKTRDKRIRPLYQDSEGYDECYGAAHALAEYRKQIPKIVLSGPTSFKPLIEASIEIARYKQQFQLLIIIGDGAVSNLSETIDSIVEASNYPIMIIMIGVGDGDFKQYPKDPWYGMKKLMNEIPERRFINFYFHQYQKDMEPREFAKEVFAQIPQAYRYCVENNMI